MIRSFGTVEPAVIPLALSPEQSRNYTNTARVWEGRGPKAQSDNVAQFWREDIVKRLQSTMTVYFKVAERKDLDYPHPGNAQGLR